MIILCRYTHSLLLGCGLLLGSSLLLRSGLLLGCSLLLSGSLGSCTKLVGGLYLDEFTRGNTVLQGLQEDTVEPLLVAHVGLHMLLDGNGGGTGAVLELRDGFDDSCFVRHGCDSY